MRRYNDTSRTGQCDLQLSTDVREAPMAGGMLFEAQAVLEAPLATSTDDLRSMLEGLAHELMVEIRLSED